MRPLLTILALLAVPGAALAQIVPVNRFPPATAPANGTLHGITVSGAATKRVAASRAQISLYLFSRTPNLNASTVQPIVDAFVKAGVAPADISLPSSFGSPANLTNATIVATVKDPTLAQMQSGIQTVGSAIAGMNNGVNVGNVQVILEFANCSNAIDDVRSAAIKNARAKAEETAKELQVKVGPVLNVVANDQVGPTGSCLSQYTVGQGNNGSISSPEDYVSVPVFANVTITYAIKN